MSNLSQTPLRIQFSPQTVPPDVPVDLNNGQMPRFWRAQAIQLNFAFWDAYGESIDLSNLIAIQLIIQKEQNSPVANVNKTIGVDEIIPVLPWGEWQAGVSQQAQFVLQAYETDLDLNSNPSALYWMTVRGFTADNQPVILGSGNIQVFNPSATLPPPTMPGIVSENKQVNSSGNSTVLPASLFHSEFITFTGAAGTRNVVINPTGTALGSSVSLVGIFDDEADNGINVIIWVAQIGGVKLFEFQRDGDEPNFLLVAVANGAGGYDNRAITIPAY